MTRLLYPCEVCSMASQVTLMSVEGSGLENIYFLHDLKDCISCLMSISVYVHHMYMSVLGLLFLGVCGIPISIWSSFLPSWITFISQSTHPSCTLTFSHLWRYDMYDWSMFLRHTFKHHLCTYLTEHFFLAEVGHPSSLSCIVNPLASTCHLVLLLYAVRMTAHSCALRLWHWFRLLACGQFWL